PPSALCPARTTRTVLARTPEWRNWQTRRIQNPLGVTPRVGSSPTFGSVPRRVRRSCSKEDARSTSGGLGRRRDLDERAAQHPPVETPAGGIVEDEPHSSRGGAARHLDLDEAIVHEAVAAGTERHEVAEHGPAAA